MYDAILHKEWEKGDEEDEIKHYWAEDNSVVVFKVPYQLRDQIVEMQNWLSVKQQKINKLKKLLRKEESFFEEN